MHESVVFTAVLYRYGGSVAWASLSFIEQACMMGRDWCECVM